jgi:hypothetical protein
MQSMVLHLWGQMPGDWLQPASLPLEHGTEQARDCSSDACAGIANRPGNLYRKDGDGTGNVVGSPVPEKPHLSYSRLSRYDATGLIWLLQEGPAVALTEATASIRNPKTGTITTYRRFNKPALGPVGDSLDDLK